MNFTEGRAPKNAYWFAAPLRGYCRHVFAEVPLRWDINFSYFNNSGIDTVGVRVENTMPEKEIIKVVNGLGAKAKAVKISKTFILDVTSLSLTTSAICAGFDYISGPAIHDPVDKPDVVHKYQYQDLLAGLMPKEKVIS